jgi:hypothetical protein
VELQAHAAGGNHRAAAAEALKQSMDSMLKDGSSMPADPG